MNEDFKEQIVQRITKNFLDILILRLIQEKPIWGYKIIKKTEKLFGLTLRHSALYPLLNSLETNNLVKSKKITKDGRLRKMYEITQRGAQFIDVYKDILNQQLNGQDIKEEKI
ncbi:MAG: PadR family transcriptional regulator [Candidatus Bathyarchaeota archaeon]